MITVIWEGDHIITKFNTIIAILLLMIAGSASTVAIEYENTQDYKMTTLSEDEYTYYWIIGQLPNQTHVYLYSREGGNVTFDGTISSPKTIIVPAYEFISYNIGNLGYTQNGTEWFFLEISSDQPMMVNFDRMVYIKTGLDEYEWKHGDQLHNMPMIKLSKVYYFPFGGSGTGDDLMAMYAHEPTEVTARIISNSGLEKIKTISIHGLYVTDYLRYWFKDFDLGGYTVILTSDKPIAAACFDELPWWPNTVWLSELFFCGPFYTELYNEYLHVHSSSNEYHSIYTPTPSTFQYYDMDYNHVSTQTYTKETSSLIRFNNVGYGGSPDPYLVHTITSSPYAESHMSPREWFHLDTGAFMGWNTSYGEIHIYTDQNAHVKIYNGKNNTLLTEFDLVQNTIFREDLVNIGFDPNEPFTVVIESNVPIYQTVKNPYYLRAYPADVAPPVTIYKPTANAGDDQTISEGDPVRLNGSSSFDTDGVIESYDWDIDTSSDSDGDGDPVNDKDVSGPSPFYVYGDNGHFVITLTVTDDDGLTCTDTCNITVLNVNPDMNMEPPTMDIEIGLRMTGSKWSNAQMTIYQGKEVIGFLEVERWPGNPYDNPTILGPWIPLDLDLTKSYSAIVTYDPFPDSGDGILGDQPNNGKDKDNNAANPVWIITKFPNGSKEKIHHTFNTQQSKKRGSSHWNHVEPWEVDIMGLLEGHTFEIESHITDPGSDDLELVYSYGLQKITKKYLNLPPNPDPFPSPEVNPKDIIDITKLTYKGPGTISLSVEDDDGGSISSDIDIK